MEERGGDDGLGPQFDRIDAELDELNRLLEDGALYQVPTVLYNEPREVPGLAELQAQHTAFAPRLKEYLQVRFRQRFEEEQRRKAEFLAAYRTWHRRLRVLEADDPPALTSARHNEAPIVPPPLPGVPVGAGGRGTRRAMVSDAVRSEEEMNQVLLSLLEQERDNPATRWMATLAVTPAMFAVTPKHITDDLFRDENGRLAQDAFVKAAEPATLSAAPVVHYNGQVVWTEVEQKVFIDKFLAYPKNFRKIASFLPFKKTADCVAFYYRNKKRLRLKQLRRMAANEANLGRIKIPRRPMAGPGRPPKKGKPGRPRKSAVSSATDDSEASSAAISSAVSFSALISPHSPVEHRRSPPVENVAVAEDAAEGTMTEGATEEED